MPPSDAVAMFKLMDKEMNNYVTWGHVLDMFIGHMNPTTEEEITAKKPPLSHDNKFKPSLHSKRETITKMIGVSSGTVIIISQRPVTTMHSGLKGAGK